MDERNVFPETARWVAHHRGAGALDSLDAYRRQVEYHLDRAFDNAQDCLGVEAFVAVEVDTDQWDVRLRPTGRAQSIAAYGSSAIVEAVAALDASLLLLNHVLGLGITDQTKISWTNRPKTRALLQQAVGGGSAVEAALDKIFGPGKDAKQHGPHDPAKGYTLLNAYRNWYVHRGAPLVLVSTRDLIVRAVPPAAAAPIPDHDPHEAQMQKDAAVQQSTSSAVARAVSTIEVWSMPFVPPVRARVNMTVDVEGRHEVLPGVVLENSTGITFKGWPVTQGSLHDPTTVFDDANAVNARKREESYAGERLDVYAGDVYRNGVMSAVNFAAAVLHDELDPAIRAALGPPP